MGNFYGVPGVEFVNHGITNDPEVVYNGHSFNYWEVENAMYNNFKEEFPEVELGDSDGSRFERYVLLRADELTAMLDEWKYLDKNTDESEM